MVSPTQKQYLAPSDEMNWQQIRARLRAAHNILSREDCPVSRLVLLGSCIDPLLDAYKKLEDKWPADAPRWPDDLPHYAEAA